MSWAGDFVSHVCLYSVATVKYTFYLRRSMSIIMMRKFGGSAETREH